ncbi:MAG: polyprenyl synthetase family protein [Thermoplasmataceae archaeon]
MSQDKMDIDPEEFISKARMNINEELRNFFIKRKNEISDPNIKKLIGQIADYTIQGGKRIRPILVVCGHDLFHKPDPEVYKAAISLELTQSFFLIHDDIMDQSDLRRGMPSLHKVLERDFEGMREARRMGENIAIVAGDIAMTYAYESLNETNFDDRIKNKAMKELISITKITGYGEGIDMLTTAGVQLKMSDLIRLHLWKTAKYTLEGPLLLGASLADYTGSTADISAYGCLTGLAFQLHDDIIGLFGKEEEIGKPIKSDVNEGKQTLLMIKAMEMASMENSDFIREILKKGNVTDNEFERIKKIVEQSGSYDYSRKLIGKFIASGKDYANKIKGNNDTKKFLLWLADYLVTRKN